ncbi:MAG: hypothetical protein AAFX06_12625 [Planctomycetota bacterium]
MTGPSLHRKAARPARICRPKQIPKSLVLVCVAALALILVPRRSLCGQTPPLDKETQQRVDELIDDLNGDGFDKRESAAESLVDMGRSVLPHLNKRRRRGLQPEQASRLKMVIAALEQSGLERRIESFLNGQPADLDNWEIFEDWFKDTPRSRELFVELVRRYPEMVLSLDGDAAKLDSGFRATIRRMNAQRVGTSSELTRADLLALLVPTASENFQTDVLVELQLLAWFHRSVGRELRNDRDWGEPFLRLVTQWMGKTSLGNRSRVLHRALDWQLDTARPLALETLQESPDPELTARCLQSIARQGTKKDLELVANYLDDERRLVTVRSMSGTLLSIEVGDVAAASIAYLNSVPVVKLGFAEPIEHPTFGIVYEQIRFPIVAGADEFETVRKQREEIRAAARKQLQPETTKPAQDD